MPLAGPLLVSLSTMRNWPAALLLILAVLPALAQAQMYRWVDDAGAVHYSQGLDSVPERYRAQARSLDLDWPRPTPAPGGKSLSPPPSLAPAVPLPVPPRARWGPSGALPEITRVSFPQGSYILVDAMINSQGPVKLLLDTGSHQTHVSAQAVRTLGISAPSYPCHSCEVEMIGGTRVVREVQILSLRVGDAEMTGPTFMDDTDSHDGLGAVGVLGRSFLDNFRVTMDFRQQVVALVPAASGGSGNRDPSVAAARVTRMPFPPHPHILVSSTINGRGPITLVLDTGAPYTWLSAKALRSVGISTENAESETLPGRKVRAVRVDVASVEVGAAKVGPLKIGTFVELETVAGADGLLGLDFLRNFTVTIDPTESVVTLERSDIPEGRSVTTHPRESIVTRGSPGDSRAPSAMPLQLEGWPLVGLAALVGLGVCAFWMVRLRRQGGHSAPGRQGHLECPQCSAHLTRLVGGEGIEVNWCERCKGTWHDKGILDEFSRESHLPRLLQEQPASSQYPSDRRCPRCGVPMEKSTLGAEKFVVDRCRSCQGLWLDHGEVARLGQLSEARPQPAMACPRCRSALEERAGPEGVVAAVCSQCWGAWYDRGELSFLASRHGELKDLLDRPAPQGLSAARCPRCEGLLEEAGLGPGKLRVERCQKCAGVWLASAEKGKLEELVARRRPPVDRTAGTTDGLVVHLGRTKAILLVLGSLSLVLLVAGVGLFDGGEWWDVALGGSLMAPIGFGLLYVLYRLCRRRLALIVNREGIVDDTAPFSAGMMKWAEIAELLVQGSDRPAQLILWIVPKRSNPNSRLKDIHIPQTALRMSPGMFVREIRRYCPETVQIRWKP